MMRPMKLAGNQLMFGEGCLEHIKTLTFKKVSIVIGGSSMQKSGMLDKVKGLFEETGAEVQVITGVEPDPSIATVRRGRDEMLTFGPDLIVGLGGGSAMDAAKTMWIFYEHPELQKMEDILPPNPFPKLHTKAQFACIPSTSGSASEVSRSVVITDDDGMKRGLGNMEMMPDIAIVAPEVCASMPKRVTAETGMDALTHALEALVSNRVNYVADTLARRAAKDIMAVLPTAVEHGDDLKARETMANASMVAGMAFTNVSLGIVHSIAQTLGSYFHISHGLADAIVLPYIIEYNSGAPYAKEIYESFAAEIGVADLAQRVRELNAELGIPATLKEALPDEKAFLDVIDAMAEMSKADGCTKTNPIIPTVPEFREIILKCYYGK
ncbi:MAG: iron-containing alcohol dehydrogenase [Lachnospiraceae bacterium]|nr:iron-containing alcohol dehydrogenase [Lachnospiraceae bacterium]